MSPLTPNDRPAPAERFAGQEHVFDLREALDRLSADPRPPHHGHRQITLFKHPTATISLFAFEAGGGMPEHKAGGFVSIHVLSGHMRVTTPEAAHTLAGGTVLLLGPGVPHALVAVEPSAMLLTVNMRAEARP